MYQGELESRQQVVSVGEKQRPRKMFFSLGEISADADAETVAYVQLPRLQQRRYHSWPLSSALLSPSPTGTPLALTSSSNSYSSEVACRLWNQGLQKLRDRARSTLQRTVVLSGCFDVENKPAGLAVPEAAGLNFVIPAEAGGCKWRGAHSLSVLAFVRMAKLLTEEREGKTKTHNTRITSRPLLRIRCEASRES